MKNKYVCLASLLAATITTGFNAQAEQVNIAGTAFQAPFLHGDDIFYSGTYALNYSSGSLTMSAPIPRVPGGGSVTVYVDGLSVAGTYSCTVWSRNFTGATASKSFTVTNATSSWWRSVNFTASEAPSWAYLAISCTTPMDGGFIGVTVVE